MKVLGQFTTLAKSESATTFTFKELCLCIDKLLKIFSFTKTFMLIHNFSCCYTKITSCWKVFPRASYWVQFLSKACHIIFLSNPTLLLNYFYYKINSSKIRTYITFKRDSNNLLLHNLFSREKLSMKQIKINLTRNSTRQILKKCNLACLQCLKMFTF